MEEDEIDDKALNKLAQGVALLDKSQRIRKTDRVGGANTGIQISFKDLASVVNKDNDEKKAVRLVDTLVKQKTLEPPKDRNLVEQTQRKVAYTEVVDLLDQWEPVVTSNRAKEHRRFPEVIHEVAKTPVENFLKKFTLTSELEKRLETLNPPAEEPEEVDEFPLTLEEIVERRKEIARLRAKQSYKEAEARRRGKIKSKKFHRVQRKEKIKQQLKEFEELQKTNPDEALRRLEQLEKTRAQERASLRHKSTGQWAKNKLVRAKYDKETRQELAEQLSIGRSLTQKVTDEPESESDKEGAEEVNADPTNPWLANIGKPEENINDFVSGYKKYWEMKNNAATIETHQPLPETNDLSEEEEEKKPIVEVKKITRKKKDKKSSRVKATTNNWEVEELQMDDLNKKIVASKAVEESIDDMFEKLDQKMQDKIDKKLRKLKKQVELESKFTKRSVNVNNEKKKKYEVDLSFKKSANKPIIDEQLHETDGKNNEYKENLISKDVIVNEIDKIDPTNFIAPKPKHLPTSLPDVDTEDNLDDLETRNKFTIVEAFEDDDIVAEFQEEKENERNADKPKLEELELPGWGAWVSKTNVNKPRKTRRILLNEPKKMRKDDKKEDVIISENVSEMLKEHQVSELPFPFTKVSDFEATIRAPIGNTFVTQTAHRKLTRPSLVTKTGIPIEPLDESVLIDRKKMKWKAN